ncbi:GDSL-type esterase/lipase family protein [Verrucomicrobiota bacterium]
MKEDSALAARNYVPGRGYLEVVRGLTIEAEGAGVRIQPGEITINNQVVALKESVWLPVAPAPEVTVVDEQMHLHPEPPQGGKKGTQLIGPHLPGFQNVNQISAYYSLTPETTKLCRQPGGTDPLRPGKDYAIIEKVALLGRVPGSTVADDDWVYASYRYAMMRLDAIEISTIGKIRIITGAPHLTVPHPPPSSRGWFRLAHVFRPYRARKVEPRHVFPIIETDAQARTETAPGRIPRTLAKLHDGRPVTIVCLGDSVTQGANASSRNKYYDNVFADGLRQRFPDSAIELKNISAGGSQLQTWLRRERGLDFQRVLDAKPDVVTLAFVNGRRRPAKEVIPEYEEAIRKLKAIGAEIILITPHFIHPDRMGHRQSLKEPDRAEFAPALRDLARKHDIGLADAAARWEHLAQEGIPYLTLLHNTLNHPDDRGHRIFAEELWKCFEKPE